MAIVNLTQHDLNLFDEAGSLVKTVPPSGTVARVSVERERTGEIENIPTFTTSYGEIVGLPAPVKGRVYVVSGMVRAAVPNGEDVFSPGALLRDDAGRVRGCIGLTQ